MTKEELNVPDDWKLWETKAKLLIEDLAIKLNQERALNKRLLRGMILLLQKAGGEVRLDKVDLALVDESLKILEHSDPKTDELVVRLEKKLVRLTD